MWAGFEGEYSEFELETEDGSVPPEQAGMTGCFSGSNSHIHKVEEPSPFSIQAAGSASMKQILNQAPIISYTDRELQVSDEPQVQLNNYLIAKSPYTSTAAEPAMCVGTSLATSSPYSNRYQQTTNNMSPYLLQKPQGGYPQHHTRGPPVPQAEPSHERQKMAGRVQVMPVQPSMMPPMQAAPRPRSEPALQFQAQPPFSAAGITGPYQQVPPRPPFPSSAAMGGHTGPGPCPLAARRR